MIINYRTEAIKELLNKDCVLQRYYSLIPLKDSLTDFYISKNCFTKEEYAAYNELYLLPGVKSTRASLYYKSDIQSLSKMADLTFQNVIDITTRTIENIPLDVYLHRQKDVCKELSRLFNND